MILISGIEVHVSSIVCFSRLSYVPIIVESASIYKQIASVANDMSHTIEISDELKTRLEGHLEEDQTLEELIEELLSIYESSRFVQEGYSE